jgi:PAS domain S-box-containing protein
MEHTDQTHTDPVLKHKIYDYIRITRQIRWVLIAMLAISFPFLVNQNRTFLLALLLVGVIYNATLHIPNVLKQRWVIAKPTILTIDCMFIYLLIWQSGQGLASPYTILFLFPIISAAFWYGIMAVLITTVAQSLVITGFLLFTGEEIGSSTTVKEFVLRMGFFAISGIYIGYLTHSDRKERLDFAAKDFQVNTERQQLLALINNIADAVLIVDQGGKIGLFNDVTAKLMGSQYDLVGKSVDEVFALLDDNNEPVTLLAAALSAPQRRRDLKMNVKDGSVIKLEADVSPYIVNQQNHGFIVILRDITKQKTLEEEQEEFISVASHELRTPVTIIEASISTTLASPNAPTDPSIHHMLEEAQDNIGFLSNIIDDLTTLSRAEQDQLEVDVDPLKPKEMLDELSNIFITQAHVKHLELHIKVDENIRPVISSRYRIKQILQNFIVNALKYTQQGSITVSVYNAPEDKDGIIFSVADTGIGISESDKKNVFKKFFRSEDYRTRESSGTGLGLYISKKLADRLNAKIWFDSELKKGSTFYLQVPPYSRRKEDHKKVVKAESQDLFTNV